MAALAAAELFTIGSTAITVGDVAMGVSALSTLTSAASTIAGGNAARGQANYQARQMEQQAGQERATAQRRAMAQRKQAALANSRVQAVAAASGGGALDPTVVDITGDIAGQGEYNALSALYTGEERARGMDMGAEARRIEGDQAKQASIIDAGSSLARGAATILGSGSTLLDKYGDGGFSQSLLNRSSRNLMA